MSSADAPPVAADAAAAATPAAADTAEKPSTLGWAEDVAPTAPNPFAGVALVKPEANAAPKALAKSEADVAPEAAKAAPEAPAAPAAPAAPEAPAPRAVVYIAGRPFATRAELVQHVKKIQESKADDAGDDGRLSSEDCLFMFHLALHHPKSLEKMTSPISHFRYGMYDTFKNKCFICVRTDGSQEGISASKCLESIFPKTGGSTVAAGAGLVGAAANTVPGSGEAAEDRGAKRARDATADDEPREKAPRVFEPVEMVRGVLVDIKGIPSKTKYHNLKDLLFEYGNVRFLGFPHWGPGGPPKKKPKKDASSEGAKEQAKDKPAESASSTAKVETVETQPSEVKAAAGAEGSADTAGAEVAKAPVAMDEEKDKGADEEADGEDEEEEEVEKDDEEADDDLVSARCRFDTPEEAKGALEKVAAAILDRFGAKVEISMTSGADEEDFWEHTNKKLKEMFDNPGGKKGKKGKGKDKGKGKGKKGKGKGKDSKGKGKGKRE